MRLKITEHPIQLIIIGVALIVSAVLIWKCAVWMDNQFAKKNKL
ncbi:hypothetical protein [Aneurinibacillus aneurinilyticus]|jgi:hypothetical protein|uniref:Uncharacterized protein n=1 Tax=Aneurinibacillus aneurinilyticus ATCC 12856 TaxID=649747 RepID=U1X179_ANEAE|nr:hypothetical protein [Aneurinibacillus aneurinilyticus]ERI08258.1 hypothetical protein HMPREF0083_03540 [Aneurinibacillus aneurinilyticus ATCC 12856]MED0669769.1 hypothetical protein [Aneurinibacillus aneurinilyticus]MED0705678.1 hypothetical protein [Aneurinibacillus aneurinilyticus]MED0725853.1 hypothetical protein [Aneurinibacillus aneurinilyticus]MED0732200.1 hypothetical protein [Aneurinibacillus aneurinilyticus]